MMHRTSLTQHSDRVAYLVKLVKPVTDVYDRHPSVAEPIDDTKESLHLARLE